MEVQRAKEKSIIVSFPIITIEKLLFSSFHSISVRFVWIYLVTVTYNTVHSVSILLCPVVTTVSIWMSSTKIILWFITFRMNKDTNDKNSGLGFLHKISVLSWRGLYTWDLPVLRGINYKVGGGVFVSGFSSPCIVCPPPYCECRSC